MRTASSAGTIRTFGRLLIIAAVVRSVTLAWLMHIAKAEHDAYYQSADAIAETVAGTTALDSARYFSKVAGEIVCGRLLERYFDQFDSVPTLVCIAIGIALCYAARRMLRGGGPNTSPKNQTTLTDPHAPARRNGRALSDPNRP